eukprot:Gb_01465 [translate_table: standard]
MHRSTQVNLCLFTSILFAFITSCSCTWTNSSYEQCKTLFALKGGVDDPYNTLASWINGSDCCRWKGVGCDVITRDVVKLNISFGGLNGTVNESLFELKSLVHLDLSNNEFSGNIPKTLGSLQKLKYLNFANSSFSGVIPSSIANLSSLTHLDLSFNEISGGIPCSLGRLSSLNYLDLSFNKLNGSIPITSLSRLSQLYWLCLPSNMLEGSISLSLFQNFSKLTALSLSINQLTVHIPTNWIPPFQLKFLGLSSCNIGGVIPPFISTQYTLIFLNFANNNLIGREIPMEIGNLPWLETLHVNGNQLTGTLSSHGLQNSSALKILNVGNNRISGDIPRWLGNLSQLSILVRRANYLEGEIPLEVTSIKTLQILDVSQNNLSGPIPHNLAKLTAMTHISQHTGFRLQNLSTIDDYYREEVQITNKGEIMSYTYATILSLVIYIDLSQNHLTGSIPSAIQELNGLITLNLSQNHLSGDIPDVFGVDMQLNSLDLSHNHLSGKVPVSLQLPGSLGVLNLSYNMLCGRIPIVRHLDTFGEDSYVGNPCLCGPPLNTSCRHGVAPPTTEHEDAEDEDETENELLWYGGLLLSHAVGFWVMLAVLFLKRERRRKCFRVMDRVAFRLLGRIGYW